MNAQFSPETIKSPEKSAQQLYAELKQLRDETQRLTVKVCELEEEARADDLPKETFNAIVVERDKLLAQIKEKREAENQLEKQLNKVEAGEISRLEEEFREVGI